MSTSPFIDPCVPTMTKEPPVGSEWAHEVKFDGYRCQVHKLAKDVTLYSRNGNDFTSRYPGAVHEIKMLPVRSVVLDCELTAINEQGEPDFSSLLNRRHHSLCVWVFDILALNGKDLRPLPLWQRRRKLDLLMKRVTSPAIQYSELFDDPESLLKACETHGLEGIVSKRIDKPYQSGRTRDWLKTKCPRWREENQWRRDFFSKLPA